MKRLTWLLALILPVVLTACGGPEEFEGRFIAPDGLTSYQFLPEGKVNINKGGEDIGTAKYKYDGGDQIITISGDTDLPSDNLAINAEGHLETGEITLTRGIASLNSSEIPRQHLMAGAVIATLPIMALFLGLERFMTKGLTAGSVKG